MAYLTAADRRILQREKHSGRNAQSRHDETDDPDDLPVPVPDNVMQDGRIFLPLPVENGGLEYCLQNRPHQNQDDDQQGKPPANSRRFGTVFSGKRRSPDDTGSDVFAISVFFRGQIRSGNDDGNLKLSKCSKRTDCIGPSVTCWRHFRRSRFLVQDGQSLHPLSAPSVFPVGPRGIFRSRFPDWPKPLQAFRLRRFFRRPNRLPAPCR